MDPIQQARTSVEIDISELDLSKLASLEGTALGSILKELQEFWATPVDEHLLLTTMHAEHSSHSMHSAHSMHSSHVQHANIG